MTFTASYLRTAIDTLAAIDTSAIEASCAHLTRTLRSGKTLFIAGNGGSAALANHLVCDFSKGPLGTANPALPRPRVLSLTANVPLLTAWANDVAYSEVFAEQLRSLARSGDCLLVISASGNSPNILRALEVARELALTSVAWVGFDGGRARRLASLAVLVPRHDYGVVEVAHDLIGHLTADYLKLQFANPDEPTQPGTPVALRTIPELLRSTEQGTSESVI